MKRIICVLMLVVTCAAAQAAVQVPVTAFYGYDGLPLNVEEKKAAESEASITYHLAYDSAHDQRVTALLAIPKGQGPFPVIIAQHGLGGSKEVDYVAAVRDVLVAQKYAVMSIDAQYHGERMRKGQESFMQVPAPFTIRDAFVQTVIDLRRAVDLLQSRPEVDTARLGYWGASMGAIQGAIFCGIDTRVKAVCLLVGGGGLEAALKKRLGITLGDDINQAMSVIEPDNFAGMISPRPLLMMNGKKDTTILPEAAQSLFDAAGEPKRIIWYDSGHTDVPVVQVMKETIGFFGDNLKGEAKQVAARPARAQLRAGAARVDITPDLKRFKKLSLAGYGDRFGKYAEGVRDHLYARALVVERGGEKVAIVALDAIGVPAEMTQAVRKNVAALGLAPEAIVITASHSHCAPECLNPQGDLLPRAMGYFHKDFFDWMAQQIAAAIRQANAGLKPCTIAVASAQLAGLNRNRRGDPAVDSEMTVAQVLDAAGKPFAVLVNWTAHATIMGPEALLVSGEWPGEMERGIEQALPGTVALYMNGAQGDQTTAGEGGEGWTRVERYGRRMAQEALALLKQARPMEDPAVAASGAMQKLPPYRVSAAFEETTGKEYHLDAKTVEAFASQILPSQAPVGALRIGDLVLLEVPGEMTAELGMGLKDGVRKMGAAHPVIAGLANAGMFYIVNPAQYRAGGYETATSFYGENIGPFMCDAIAAHARKVMGQ